MRAAYSSDAVCFAVLRDGLARRIVKLCPLVFDTNNAPTTYVRYDGYCTTNRQEIQGAGALRPWRAPPAAELGDVARADVGEGQSSPMMVVRRTLARR